MKISGRQRKGISPIIATVLIIAATLIAFAAVAGYIFGLFGSSTKSAQAQVISESLTSGTSVAPTATSAGTLTLSFSNSGGQSVTITSASVAIAGSTYSVSGTTNILYYTASGGALYAANGVLPATTTTVYIGLLETTGSTPAAFSSGTTYTFSLVLSNGITSTITVTAS